MKIIENDEFGYGAPQGKAKFDDISLAQKPFRQLEKLILEQVSDDQKRKTLFQGVSILQVAQLAVDALGNQDPQFLINLYVSGGSITEEVLGILASSVIRGRDGKKDSLEWFSHFCESRGVRI